ncbi:MAG: hypothetical protein I3274_00190 [Candidatus Moeniiplasma glomeromycotorum]|nr:hypothetical protein [Candidatus Moeniiplasma glomeromycotorum]
MEKNFSNLYRYSSCHCWRCLPKYRSSPYTQNREYARLKPYFRENARITATKLG